MMMSPARLNAMVLRSVSTADAMTAPHAMDETMRDGDIDHPACGCKAIVPPSRRARPAAFQGLVADPAIADDVLVQVLGPVGPIACHDKMRRSRRRNVAIHCGGAAQSHDPSIDAGAAARVQRKVRP